MSENKAGLKVLLKEGFPYSPFSISSVLKSDVPSTPKATP